MTQSEQPRPTGDAEEDGPCLDPRDGWRDRILRAQSGDREALEAIVLAQEKRVLNVAWRMLFSLDDARDAAQEVFVRLLKYLPSLDPDRDPSAWFYRTTVNVCRDVEARRRRWAWIPLGGPEGEERDVADDAPDLLERMALTQEAARVVRGLRALPAKERAVLVLRDVEGLETSEVARILGSSETTVRSQASRARVRIKRILEREP